jgi:hypothetical protein
LDAVTAVLIPSSPRQICREKLENRSTRLLSENQTRQTAMKQQDPFDYWRRIGLRVSPPRLFAWFFGINLPIAIMLGAFMHWRNGIAGEPSPLQMLMLMAIAFVAFSAGMIVMWYKVLKPAIQAEREAAGPKEQDKRT